MPLLAASWQPGAQSLPDALMLSKARHRRLKGGWGLTLSMAVYQFRCHRRGFHRHPQWRVPACYSLLPNSVRAELAVSVWDKLHEVAKCPSSSELVCRFGLALSLSYFINVQLLASTSWSTWTACKAQYKLQTHAFATFRCFWRCDDIMHNIQKSKHIQSAKGSKSRVFTVSVQHKHCLDEEQVYIWQWLHSDSP